MDNLFQHSSHQPTLLVVLAVALILLIISVPYFINQRKRYGTLFEFAPMPKKLVSGASLLVLIGGIIYGLTPYVPPPTDEIAIVLGNTQNTPAPTISNEISAAIEGTMLRHKGESADELADSIKVISAVKQPVVISLDASDLKLRDIGNNSSNAKRSAGIDIKAINEKLNNLPPTDNGANYLEAILEARDNVSKGSKIIVIGSGLSDTGDLNFSQSNILTNEQSRQYVLQKIKKKYGYNYLNQYSVEFYGLGDTAKPQEALSSKQKEVVREIYKDTIRSLGGDVGINTKTLAGDSIKTDYVVGTTDTGCGDIGLVFDDNNLKFVGNEAKFIDETAAKESLTTIKTFWDKYSDIISSIQIDGYIAHYPGFGTLSQKRANLVKKVLINLGIPADKIKATGRGFGPYKQDAQNRMVKVTISRDNDQCEE